MIRRHLTLAAFALLAGCAAAPSVPDDYTGPRAQLDDSFKAISSFKAEMYVAVTLNGQPTGNAIEHTLKQNAGRGRVLVPLSYGRPVVAGQPLQVGVRARTQFGAPIQELTNTVYELKGTVTFTPEAGGRYVVRGELGPQGSAVWIENAATGEPVAPKVQVSGPSKASFFGG